MTDDRMALIEALQKADDGNFLRSLAETVLQILMEADVEGMIGAGWHAGHELAVPNNLSLVLLPPYSPELNPVENVRQYLRAQLAHDQRLRQLRRHL